MQLLEILLVNITKLIILILLILLKLKKFKLMEKYKSTFTDDTITTLAVAKSILECNNNYESLKQILINNMVNIDRKYSQLL